ncbi:unnamed protein product [Cunninghamella blakesleeana]
MRLVTILVIAFGSASCYAGAIPKPIDNAIKCADENEPEPEPTLEPTPVPEPTTYPPPTTQCNNGPVQCCNELKNYNEYSLQQLSSLTNGLLGLSATDVLKGQLGLNCNAVNVLLLGVGNQCSQQAVCCDQVSSSSLVGIGCTPINANL